MTSHALLTTFASSLPKTERAWPSCSVPTAPLVDAIVRQSHFRQIIDLCLRMLALIVATRLSWVLREELAHRKRKRDRKPDPENLKRNNAIRAAWKTGKTLGQLAKNYRLSRQRIQQIVREKVSSN